jgi:hypothetical protein
MIKITVRFLWGTVLAACILGLMLLPNPDANASGCDERWESCQAPRWCPTTGTLVPPFSGYCPVGPHSYSPPWGEDDDDA